MHNIFLHNRKIQNYSEMIFYANMVISLIRGDNIFLGRIMITLLIFSTFTRVKFPIELILVCYYATYVFHKFKYASYCNYGNEMLLQTNL